MSSIFPKFKMFSDVQQHLDALGMFHMKLSLSRMETFSAAWGGGLPGVHVVGTNGKGSTSVFFESIAREHGLHTGLYTSPHFLSPRERVRVTGQMLSESVWVHGGNKLSELCPEVGLTYFEWLTALAALLFDEEGVDVAVMEAGLGGRYDATRVFGPELVLLTPVGLDHEAYLGDTLQQVADDKCRAIGPGCTVVTAPQAPEVMRVYERRAELVGARLTVASPLAGAELGLAGAYQSVNAGLALAGWRAWADRRGITVDENAAARGLALAWLPGRFQVVEPHGTSPGFVLDGAHNGHGLAALKQALDERGVQPDAVIFGCMADKNVGEMAEAVRGMSPGALIATSVPGNERAMDAETLAAALGPRATAAQNMREALNRAGDAGAKIIMVCGSLYLLAEFYKLHPALLDAPGR